MSQGLETSAALSSLQLQPPPGVHSVSPNFPSTQTPITITFTEDHSRRFTPSCPPGTLSVSNPRVLMGLPPFTLSTAAPLVPISILHPWAALTLSPAGKQLGPAFPQLSSSRHVRQISFLRFRSLPSLLRSHPPPRLSAIILVCLSLTATIGLLPGFSH
ncbi:hypothetical protein BO78DRAFT_58544 [Aspergillus sclerotiicarbonarius CBS 121057]|uniref:Uncharacterized protein n=1 Tax=Aspergillus sclerotiicarbonarius (strain CBS 121057 / IBT 28362) TaxID=1448318 RepID=A0A319ELQ5_ASPSB|nr:hypothetical protein BO78DRAFT_58544 [Aspergillus sclerotiicarbonarius CBS 121057]